MKKLYAGQVYPADDPQIRELLTAMKKILDNGYLNSDYSALTWDEAANILRTDKALLYPMGDQGRSC